MNDPRGAPHAVWFDIPGEPGMRDSEGNRLACTR